MATSRITFYLTDIDPARNIVVEHIESYLATVARSYENVEVMYIKPGIDVTVNMNWPQSVGWSPDNNTYARVVTDSKIYYYFVTDTK